MKVVTKTKAVDQIKNGFPVAFQTDTLPAIGCLPEYSEMIYKIKKREKSKALILMASELNQILEFVHELAKDDVKNISEKFWPGALTLVIPIAEKNKLDFISKKNTLGVRIPNSFTAKSFINATGPLATSSANISGLEPSITAKDVSKYLPDLNLLGPIPWAKCSGKASTIITWISKGEWKLIRKGQILISDL